MRDGADVCQGHKPPQTALNTLQIHGVTFHQRLCNLASLSNEDLRRQEKGRVQFKFKPPTHPSSTGRAGLFAQTDRQQE